jgi:rRNA-processing protein FCF1
MVFHEIVWFFKSREIDRNRAKLKIEEFLTNEKTVFVQCTADDVRFSIARITNYRKYNDYLILSVARRLELPLYTFDLELKKEATKYGVKVYKNS